MTVIIDDLGERLPCMWMDCARDGHEEFKAVVTEPVGVDPKLIVRAAPNPTERWKRIHFVFCCEGHKLLWVNSVADLGNRPMGSRGTLL